MAIDSRAKGAKGENDVAKVLKAHTKLDFLRVPLSGALDAKHGLKGDLYLLGGICRYCIEVKFYAEDHISSKILTDKIPKIQTWWEQCEREAKQINKIPLLIFKFNRSKMFVAFEDLPTQIYNYITICVNDHVFHTAELNTWLKNEGPKFV